MSRMLRSAVRALFCGALLGTLLAWLAPAHAAIDLAAVIPPGPEVKVGTLANGLTYYVRRNGKPEHRVELRLVVKAGSVLEDEDQQGLAHFVEHMAFQGTTHFQKHELVSYLQSIGVSFGADLNAATSFDETAYMLPVPTERKEYVERAFTVLEDWAHGLRLDDADIDKERAVVLEELRLGKGAGERVGKVMLPRLLNGSRYAERLPIGKEEIIRHAKPEALRRFYRDWYRPDLMAVIVVGDIDPAEAEQLIKAHFAGLANPAQERPRRYPEIPARGATEALVVTDKEITTNMVSLDYPVRFAPDRATVGDYRGHIVERLFGAMLSERLNELAQQPTPPFMHAHAGIGRTFPGYAGYSASATLGAGGAAPALAALLQEQQRLRAHGFTEAELERARRVTLHNYERYYLERDTTNSVKYVNEYQRSFLAGEEIGGAAFEYKLMQEMVPGIGLDEMNAFARKTLPVDAGKLVLYVGGEGKDQAAPDVAQLLAATRAAEQAPASARTEKALASELMARPAKPGGIVEKSHDDRLGLTRLTLSNGVKVVLKPTDFAKNQVLLAAARYGGQDLFDQADIANARYATSVAEAMGLKDFAPSDLRKILAGRTAGASVSLGGLTDSVHAHAASSDAELETMFQLLWLRFDGARSDAQLYQSYMGKQVEMLRNRLATPEARFEDTLVDTLYGSHPYEPREVTLADANQVSLARSLAVYRQRFSSAKGLTFNIVGDFDVARIEPLVAAYLGTLPTPDLPLAYRDVGLRLAKGVIKKEVLAGSEPKSTISLIFSGPAVWSQGEELRMNALMQVMNLRIMDVLREQMRLIYEGGMSGSVQRIPYQHYTIQATLPTAPESVDKVVAALFADIERMKTQGPDQADLVKYKQHWHQNYQRAMRENGFWLASLQSAQLDGTDPGRLLTVADEVDAISAEDLRQAARRYFDVGNYVQVVLKPEAPPRVASAPN